MTVLWKICIVEEKEDRVSYITPTSRSVEYAAKMFINKIFSSEDISGLGPPYYPHLVQILLRKGWEPYAHAKGGGDGNSNVFCLRKIVDS